MHKVTVYLMEPPAGLSTDDINQILGDTGHVRHDEVQFWFSRSFRGPYDQRLRYIEAVSYEVDSAPMEACDEAFMLFNVGPESDERVAEYRRPGRRSLSVGDVVVYEYDEIGEVAFLCASVGWTHLPEFDLRRAKIETVLEEVRHHVGDNLELVYVSYDDKLSDEQLANVFTGDAGAAGESVAEWSGEAQFYGARYYLTEGFPAGLRARIDDLDCEEEVRSLLYDLDTSTPFDDLLAKTGPQLFAYKIGDRDANADEPDVEQAFGSNNEEYLDAKERAQIDKITEVLAAAGADVTLPSNQAAIGSLVAENLYHGGVIYALWYGPPHDLAKQVMAAQFKQPGHDIPKTITFTNPHILVWNGWAGAGFEEQIEGELVVEWDPERLVLDGHGTGVSSIDSCFGFHRPALAGDPTITERQTQEA